MNVPLRYLIYQSSTRCGLKNKPFKIDEINQGFKENKSL